MYVNEKYQLGPSTLGCDAEPIRPGRYYQFGMTRTSEGNVTLYLNGYECATGVPSSANGYKLDTEHAVFLRGPKGASSGGSVKRIQVWDQALESGKMAAAAS